MSFKVFAAGAAMAYTRDAEFSHAPTIWTSGRVLLFEDGQISLMQCDPETDRWEPIETIVPERWDRDAIVRAVMAGKETVEEIPQSAVIWICNQLGW